MSNARAHRRRLVREADKAARLLGSVPTPVAVPAEAGKVNIWACPACGRPTIARDIHEGVTPMVLLCRGNAAHFNDRGELLDEYEDDACKGMARSCFYQLPPDESTPAPIAELLADPIWEWYVPTDPDELAEFQRDGSGIYQHVLQGGLVLRKVRPGDQRLAPSPNDPAPIEGPAKGRWARFWKGLAGHPGT